MGSPVCHTHPHTPDEGHYQNGNSHAPSHWVCHSCHRRDDLVATLSGLHRHALLLVADATDTLPGDILSDLRYAPFVAARRLLYQVWQAGCGANPAEMSRLRDCNHSTIVHSLAAIQRDPDGLALASAILAQLGDVPALTVRRALLPLAAQAPVTAWLRLQEAPHHPPWHLAASAILGLHTLATQPGVRASLLGAMEPETAGQMGYRLAIQARAAGLRWAVPA